MLCGGLLPGFALVKHGLQRLLLRRMLPNLLANPALQLRAESFVTPHAHGMGSQQVRMHIRFKDDSAHRRSTPPMHTYGLRPLGDGQWPVVNGMWPMKYGLYRPKWACGL